MERLIAVSQDAVFKLESEPVSTVDFVNLLKYVCIYTCMGSEHTTSPYNVYT